MYSTHVPLFCLQMSVCYVHQALGNGAHSGKQGPDVILLSVHLTPHGEEEAGGNYIIADFV